MLSFVTGTMMTPQQLNYQENKFTNLSTVLQLRSLKNTTLEFNHFVIYRDSEILNILVVVKVSFPDL